MDQRQAAAPPARCDVSEGASEGVSEPYETYEDICTFCKEARGELNGFHALGVAIGPRDHILQESPNFVVVPCIGALTGWYVLIVPRRHVMSTGWMDQEERDELRALSGEVRRRLAARAGSQVVIFEHGSYSFRDRGGACHDHAHIHVVATERPVEEFVDYVSSNVTLEPCDDWIEAAAAMVNRSLRSYLALASQEGSWIGHVDRAPSGFFRKSMMRWLGEDPDQHDWLVYPQTERLRSMVVKGI